MARRADSAWVPDAPGCGTVCELPQFCWRLCLSSRPRRPGRQIRSTYLLVPSIVPGVTLIGLPFACAVWAKGSISAGVVAVLYAAMQLATILPGQKMGDVPGAIPVLAIGMGGVGLGQRWVASMWLIKCDEVSADVTDAVTLKITKRTERPFLPSDSKEG